MTDITGQTMPVHDDGEPYATRRRRWTARILATRQAQAAGAVMDVYSDDDDRNERYLHFMDGPYGTAWHTTPGIHPDAAYAAVAGWSHVATVDLDAEA
jgi:hypothetical protein